MAKATTEQKQVIELLQTHGAILERTRKHHIWRLPDGRSFALPSSPSCAHSWKNNLSDLRKFLGVNDPDRGKAGERRKRKIKTPQPIYIVSNSPEKPRVPEGPTMWDALMAFRAKLPPVQIREPEVLFLWQFSKIVPYLEWNWENQKDRTKIYVSVHNVASSLWNVIATWSKRIVHMLNISAARVVLDSGLVHRVASVWLKNLSANTRECVSEKSRTM